MSDVKIIKKKQAKSFKFDQYLEIFNYFTKDDYAALSIVKGYLHGPHSNRVNHGIAKLYFVISGTLKMIVNGLPYDLESQDALMVTPGQCHSMEGNNAEVLMICSPAYDSSDEIFYD